MKKEFEIYCYETEEGQICLEFDDSGVSFTKKRFLEFADKLNEVREAVLLEFLQTDESNTAVFKNSYHL